MHNDSANFAPVHAKSEHSAGYGTASVETLVKRCAEFGYPALALTDVENLYGQVKFHYAARAYGVKPITGLELRRGFGSHSVGSKKGRLVLLARLSARVSGIGGAAVAGPVSDAEWSPGDSRHIANVREALWRLDYRA